MGVQYQSVGMLVRAVKTARQHPNAQFRVPGDWPLTAAAILANFKRGVMRRCNRGLAIASDERSRDIEHDARIINDAAKGIVWPGRNLLQDRRMARRYPAIHNPPTE